MEKERKLENLDEAENRVVGDNLTENKEETPNLEKENRELKERISELEAQLKEIQNAARVIKATFENYKLDADRQIRDASRTTALRIMKTMIPLLDDFKRAFKHLELSNNLEEFKIGVEKIYEKFVRTLENEGLKQIDASGKFDPFNHEAFEREEREDLEEYTITEIIEDGYTFNGQVIKPAKVKVAVKPRKKKETVENAESTNINKVSGEGKNSESSAENRGEA
ncbi:nucleotide exchange factor GrpE [Fervidobacterium gondwanense]|uniref:nucleotide exchange factor GrpE n=1 Tax=Fervidobacterium gondwanense TaxID=44754 RepID=UPI003C756279